jgi:hypothetical protein
VLPGLRERDGFVILQEAEIIVVDVDPVSGAAGGLGDDP